MLPPGPFNNLLRFQHFILSLALLLCLVNSPLCFLRPSRHLYEPFQAKGSTALGSHQPPLQCVVPWSRRPVTGFKVAISLGYKVMSVSTKRYSCDFTICTSFSHKPCCNHKRAHATGVVQWGPPVKFSRNCWSGPCNCSCRYSFFVQIFCDLQPPILKISKLQEFHAGFHFTYHAGKFH